MLWAVLFMFLWQVNDVQCVWLDCCPTALQVSGRAQETFDHAKQSAQESWDTTKARAQETADKVREQGWLAEQQCKEQSRYFCLLVMMPCVHGLFIHVLPCAEAPETARNSSPSRRSPLQGLHIWHAVWHCCAWQNGLQDESSPATLCALAVSRSPATVRVLD